MNKNKIFQEIKNQLCKGFLATVAMLSVAACSNDDNALEIPDVPVQNEDLPTGWVSARGRMEMTVTTYDGESAPTRAEETDTWKEGDKIYFIIESGQTKTPVVAVYSKVFSAWSFNYNASATIPASGTMKGCYLEGATSSDYSGATLGADGIVYIDSKASYTYQNGEFAITVHLKPSYVRLRFAGTQGQAVMFSGLSRVTSFDATTYTFEQTPVAKWIDVSSTAEDDKYYTPYVYGYLNADNKIYISTNGNTYGRTITASMLSAGESAWMTMPSENYIPKGWNWADVGIDSSSRTFVVNGVTFKMIHVGTGTFNMGGTEEADEQPIHSVTLTKSYFIGETEVTQELYQAIMGYNPSDYTGNLRPVETVSWDDCLNFIARINSLTGLTFRLPTEAEWEYAARGGNKSQGYIYSGSNSIGDVAWFVQNSANHRNVKSLNPNELGIYDMSGNVSEWCQDWYDIYINGAQIDPTGPISGSERVIRGGGSWDYYGTNCRVASRTKASPSEAVYSIGFRLAL